MRQVDRRVDGRKKQGHRSKVLMLQADGHSVKIPRYGWKNGTTTSETAKRLVILVEGLFRQYIYQKVFVIDFAFRIVALQGKSAT